jgi:hypothetical protein
MREAAPDLIVRPIPGPAIELDVEAATARSTSSSTLFLSLSRPVLLALLLAWMVLAPTFSTQARELAQARGP